MSAPTPIGQLIPIGELSAALSEAGYEAPAYHQLWRDCVDDRYPAQSIGGRWHVRRCDLGKVAERLKLPASQ